MIHVEGSRELEARLRAVQRTPKQMLGRLGLRAVREQKRLVPRKTGNLGRTIHLGSVTTTSATTVAGARYAAAVEYGTKPHEIRPRRAKALRFPAKGSPTTLGGRVKKGGAFAFAKVVRHPGTKPQPFMVPGAEAAIRTEGVDVIVTAWNDAA